MAELQKDIKNLYGLVRVLEDASADDATKANAARVLGNIAAASYADNRAVVAAGAIPLLVEVLSGGSEWGREMAANALSNLAALGSPDI